ncbi:MAG: hypothetical protein F4092_05095 [Rhodospirillaceae bacterium]|nr:hypothetical protein [Rhodospirillaceae bacterium]
MMKWTSMPEPTEEKIEEEVVFLIRQVINYKNRNDRPEAEWQVGTASDSGECLKHLSGPAIALSGWCRGSACRAVREMAEYHGMKIEGATSNYDTAVYAHTDRFPTMEERKQRSKEPLTAKQKLAFREIKKFIERNGNGPTRTELMRILGHRSFISTKESLDILERKNWAILSEDQRRIELI